jgi:hypothetical protein
MIGSIIMVAAALTGFVSGGWFVRALEDERPPPWVKGLHRS